MCIDQYSVYIQVACQIRIVLGGYELMFTKTYLDLKKIIVYPLQTLQSTSVFVGSLWYFW